ncbi:MAG: hypothetical protein J7M25_04625 [Deltaproteobacteria bacterium]|nr:hypothetical protein [Deltaproteobacteria bacterium]
MKGLGGRHGLLEQNNIDKTRQDKTRQDKTRQARRMPWANMVLAWLGGLLVTMSAHETDPLFARFSGLLQVTRQRKGLSVVRYGGTP